MTQSEQEVFDNIEKYGCHVMHILENENNSIKEPRFSYSIGLFKNYKQPEIVIIGLKQELAHILINNICYDYQQGTFLNSGKYNADILDSFDCLIVDVDKKHYQNYLGWASWYYKGDNFPVLQVIYPTIKGIFPWEKKYPRELGQPILNEKFKTGL